MSCVRDSVQHGIRIRDNDTLTVCADANQAVVTFTRNAEVVRTVPLTLAECRLAVTLWRTSHVILVAPSDQ